MSQRRRSRRPIPRKPKPGAGSGAPSAAKPKAVTPKAATPKAVTPKATPAKAPPAKAAPAKAVPPKAAAPKAAAAQTPAADPWIGKTIARCTLREVVGRGKTATVYRAHHEAFDIEVAVKILTPQASAIPQLIERFQSEAKVVARLDNENIVKIYDVGSEGDAHFIVMELLDGFSILDLIQRDGQVDPMEALSIARQTANGLVAAHDKGIIHRDIKPQNLLLLEDGTVKVLDFGLAAGFDDTGERVGTPHYMAPETCRDGTADLGSDVYALGIVLFHMLTGQPPYAGNGIKDILRLHMEGPALRPETKVQGLGKEVAELVRTLTKGDPLLRPTASEVINLIDGIGGEAVKEKDALRKRRSARSRVRAAARRKSSPMPIVIGLVVVAAIIGFIAMGSGSDPKDEGTEVAGPTGGTTPGASTPSGSLPGGPPEPNDPTPVVETAAQAAAREQLAAQQAKEKEQREKERKAKEAFDRVQQWARDNWEGEAQTGAVVEKLRRVSDQFRKTEAGKAAKTRYKAILARKAHPHPDRSYDDEGSIADVRQKWISDRAELEKRIAQHDYEGAKALLPANVNDRDGELSGEIAFWRHTLSLLRGLQTRLGNSVRNAEGDVPTIETPEGTAVVKAVTAVHWRVRVAGKEQKYGWADLDAAAILAFASEIREAQDADAMLEGLAFAFAHRLEDGFWDLQLELTGTSGASEQKRRLSAYEAKIDDRIKAGRAGG